MPKSGYQQFMDFGRNPFVLQPVKRVEFSNSCLLVLPGISHTPIYRSDTNSVRFISSRLSEFSIKSEDVREENIGFLPPTSGYTMPVLLDHGCTTGNEELLLSFKNDDDYTKYQKNAFRELRQLMHNSWQGYSPKNSGDLNLLLSYCQKHVSMDIANPNKRIHNAWIEVPETVRKDHKPLNVKRAAAKYNARLSQRMAIA